MQRSENLPRNAKKTKLQGVVTIRFQYLTDCSLWMIVCLAGENRLMTSRELEEKIPFPQQSIFSAGRKLKKHGFIKTINGPFGGYMLAKPPEEIIVREILAAYDDTFSINSEVQEEEASTAVLQNYMNRLVTVKNGIDKELSFNLADLLEKGN